MEPFMDLLLKKTVALVGMMGSGKTTIGLAVARTLSVPFMDSDAEIEKAANLSISEIFERCGESFFRRKETQVIVRLLEGECGILSTGGGVFLNPANRRVISERGVALWLRADLDLLWSRVRRKDTRPLLKTADPFATLAELCDARNPVYGLADLQVEICGEYSVQDTAERVLGALQSRPDVLARPS
ncbi:MAG: shikimate kinase [Rhodobacter sp.]|nr:shikimate kinase [Rhodobacter sp.]MCY4168595.1 shikimate kinase [Rhodobacter sp.]MCY4240957.1 shikimate kinase [Rhodobacter sp.]